MDHLSETEDINRHHAACVIETCMANGIHHFFVAPGSRCTPLTLAIANHPKANAIQHFDERGLAFACLGFGRATHQPAAFVCTSGTAVANAFPAVIEASLEEVPMLLLTADRPDELHGIGSNQTIDQQNIFGNYPTKFLNLRSPKQATPLSTKATSSQVAEALSFTNHGPVHINCMLREPFGESDDRVTCDVAAQPRVTSNRKHREIHLPQGESIVVLGGCHPKDARLVQRFADSMSAPLLADITSSVRSLSYDLALMRQDLPTPQNVFHFGKRFVSKRLTQFIEKAELTNYWQIGSHQQNIDPCRKMTKRVNVSIEHFCQLAGAPHVAGQDVRTSSTFSDVWKSQCHSAKRLAETFLAESPNLSEPFVAQAIADLIPSESGLFIGNSMPIRDFDMFAHWTSDKQIVVGANRGASGIDGLLATASGFAEGIRRPVTFVCGDLSMLHDLNSLALMKNSNFPIIAVLINNHGGGIFHFLPVVANSKHFEPFFGTPHELNFDHAANQFGIPYTRCSNIDSFREAYQSHSAAGTSGILEVVTNREENVALHRRIAESICAGRD